MKKTAIVAAVALILSICRVYAAASEITTVFQPDVQSSQITATASVEVGKSYLIIVVKGGKTIEESEAHKENIVYTGYTQNSADGTLNIAFKMNDARSENGSYDIYLMDGEGNYITSSFYYTLPSVFNSKYEIIKENITATGLEDFAKTFEYALGLDDFAPFVAVGNDKQLYTNLCECVVADPTLISTPQKLSEAYKTASVLTAFNSGNNCCVDSDYKFIYSNLLGCSDEKYLYSYYDSLNSEGLKNVYIMLSGKDFTTSLQFNDSFKEAVYIQSIINNKNMGYAHVRGLLSLGAFDLLLSDYNALTNSAKSKVDMELTSQKIDTVKQLQNSIDTLCEENSSSQSVGRPTGGGGGGGGGSVGISVPISTQPPIVVQPEDSEKKSDFSDMLGYEWASEAVSRLAEKSIVSGTGDGKFEPQREITREEFVKLLVEITETELSVSEKTFSDVESEHWASRYISAAVKSGIVLGKPDGSFGLGENILREDCALMLYRVIGSTTEKSSALFGDDGNISDYAKIAVYSLRELNIINGNSQNEFMPLSFCTRAEAAVMICGAIDAMQKN